MDGFPDVDFGQLADPLADQFFLEPAGNVVQDSQDVDDDPEEVQEDVEEDVGQYAEQNVIQQTPYDAKESENEIDTFIREHMSGAVEREASGAIESVNTSERMNRIEIAIPEMSPTLREEYEEVHSDTVERVMAEVPLEKGQLCYKIEFTDGREDLVSGVCFRMPLAVRSILLEYDSL